MQQQQMSRCCCWELAGGSCCLPWLLHLLLPSAPALLLCWHSVAWESVGCPLQEVLALLWDHALPGMLLLQQPLLLPAHVLVCVGVPCWAPGVQDRCCCPVAGQL
jgi:hypothetical protein